MNQGSSLPLTMFAARPFVSSMALIAEAGANVPWRMRMWMFLRPEGPHAA